MKELCAEGRDFLEKAETRAFNEYERSAIVAGCVASWKIAIMLSRLPIGKALVLTSFGFSAAHQRSTINC